jgi:sigma-B regulation protein RsbU (phosphoserine phosphatase)
VPAIAVYVAIFWLDQKAGLNSGALVASELPALVLRLRFDASAIVTAVALGYTLFIVFIAGEGRRYLRAHAEIALAQDMHRHLVPAIDRTIGAYEFFGASLPSAEVGGDLVDVVDDDGQWVACVADVSGHGVASGALMGMFKSAVRTRLAVGPSLDALLTEVSRVLVGLRKPGMFVTCAFVAGGAADEGLRFTMAGHPPILHRRETSGGVEELSLPQLPIAMLEKAPPFRSAAIDVRRGDVLALVSDGLIEVFDRQDDGYGIERLKATLAANATRPLKELFDTILAAVRHHGPQIDDQSLLLVRVLR